MTRPISVHEKFAPKIEADRKYAHAQGGFFPHFRDNVNGTEPDVKLSVPFTGKGMQTVCRCPLVYFALIMLLRVAMIRLKCWVHGLGQVLLKSAVFNSAQGHCPPAPLVLSLGAGGGLLGALPPQKKQQNIQVWQVRPIKPKGGSMARALR